MKHYHVDIYCIKTRKLVAKQRCNTLEEAQAIEDTYLWSDNLRVIIDECIAMEWI